MPTVDQYLQSLGWKQHELLIHGNMNDSDRYRSYEIRQGRGKRRIIQEPKPTMKKIQKDLIPIFEQFQFHPGCVARKGFGINANVAPHEGARHVLRVDISKCYPSTTLDMIERSIDKYISNHELRTNMKVATRVYCMYQPDNIGKSILPTGAPTSPILCNIALTPVDYAITQIASELGYKYTRYIDDIHLSTTAKHRDWTLLDQVSLIIRQAGWQINKKKTRWLWADSNDAMNITGIRLGDGPKVPRQFRRMMRAKLQNLAKQGKDLDAEAKGCLAYIKSIDEPRFHQLLEYYERRRAYAPSSGK